jgi:Glycosyltransferase family 87
MIPKDLDQDREAPRVRLCGIISLALIVIWAAWWIKSIQQDSLVYGKLTWVSPLPFLAGDFKVHIDHTARLVAAGVNPYRLTDDWVCAQFPYPPMIPRLFVWVALVSTPTAVKIWLGAVATFLGIGAWVAWRTRRALGLWPVSLPVLVAALIYSTPAVLAMERGQCDPLVIPAMLAVAWLARGGSAGRQLATGSLLGLTAWIKYYPGLAVVGLLALGRWKAASAFVVVVGLIGLFDRVEVRQSIENGKALSHGISATPVVLPTVHSIVSCWKALPVVRANRPLRRISPPVAAALLLVPVLIAVSRQVAQSREATSLIAPYFLWLTALATFAMPYAIDYNLIPLPLAALCVWDRRDPVFVHMMMGLFLLWWQPIELNVSGNVLLVIKLGALYAVGYCLARRAIDQTLSCYESMN